jgi:hypothetical protein
VKSEVHIPAPAPHQVGVDQAPTRYKVCPWGRRRGKTVWSFKAAIVGHGPTQPDGQPMFPGVAQGWDVVWIPPDYTQAKTLWREWVKPRFEDVDGVTLNNTDFSVFFEDGGAFHIRSNENIRSVRGFGKRLKGVIFEEAAHFDLEYAWRDVVRPMLADNIGWAIFISTTNGGQDGNTEKVAPSFFNRLVQEIRDGKRDPAEWGEWHGTARDNPRISPDECAAMVAEYPADSVSLKQEIEAELVQGGAGLAFPEWSTSVHVVSWEPPPGWGWAGGFDWGYESPGWCGIARLDGTEGGMFREELAFRRMTAYEVGQKVGRMIQRHDFTPQFPIFADPSAFNPLDGRPTFAQDVQRGLSDVLQQRSPVLVPAAQVRSDGKSPRIFGKLLMHKALRWGPYAEDGTLPNHLRPRWVVHKACSELARSIASLPIDERNIEDVDTEAFDHPYDGARYLLQSQYMPEVSKPERKKEHIHPGWAKDDAGQMVRANRMDPTVRPRFRTTFSMRNEGEN